MQSSGHAGEETEERDGETSSGGKGVRGDEEEGTVSVHESEMGHLPMQSNV